MTTTRVICRCVCVVRVGWGKNCVTISSKKKKLTIFHFRLSIQIINFVEKKKYYILYTRSVGINVGSRVGLSLGFNVGSLVGILVGLNVGIYVGLNVGIYVGLKVGILLGLLVG